VTRLLVMIVALGLGASCSGASASSLGTSGRTTGDPRVQGRAPLSVPWSRVRIIGGTAGQHRALRQILHGFGWTAIRRIRIAAPPSDVRGRGSGFSYVIAVPQRATHEGILGFQGEWQAAMVGESYAAIQSTRQLPKLSYQAFSDRLPDGKLVGLSGGIDTDYDGKLERLPSRATVTSAVHKAAQRAGFQLGYLGFVRPYRLPVIIVSLQDHTRLRQRLDRFLGHVLPMPQINLAYVQLDTSCGRPVFARGQGVAIDPNWFNICDFTLGCPTAMDGSKPPRLTYAC
jgi:hypothetical protein